MRKFLVFFLICCTLILLGCESNFVRVKMTSSSMDPDLKFGEVYDFEKVDPSTLKVGDIIAYEMVEGIIVVSRIVRIQEDNNGVYFTCKSTNNKEEHMDRIRYDNVVGIYRG